VNREMRFLPEDLELKSLLEKQNNFWSGKIRKPLPAEARETLLGKPWVEYHLQEYVLRGWGKINANDWDWRMRITKDEAREILSSYGGDQDRRTIAENTINSAKEVLMKKLLAEDGEVSLSVGEGADKEAIVDELVEILSLIESYEDSDLMVKIKTLLMMMYDGSMLSQVANKLNLTKAEEQLIFERMSSLLITVGSRENISFDHVLSMRRRAQLTKIAEAIEVSLEVGGFAKELILSEDPDEVRGMVDGLLLRFDATREFDREYSKVISLMVADKWVDQNKESEAFGKMSLSDKEKLLTSLRMMAGGDNEIDSFLLNLDQRLNSGALKDNWQKIIKDDQVKELIRDILITLSTHEEEIAGRAEKTRDLNLRVEEWMFVKNQMEDLYSKIDQLLADNLRERVKNDVVRRIGENIELNLLLSDLEKIDSKIQGKDKILKEWRQIVREMMFERGKEFLAVVSLLKSEGGHSRLTRKSIGAMRQMAIEVGWDHLNKEKDDLAFVRKINELMLLSVALNSTELLSEERAAVKIALNRTLHVS